MPISSPFNVLSGGADISEAGTPAVGGPGSGGSTDNALVRWDGTSGLLVQNGIVTEADDTGALTGPIFSATTTAAGVAFTNQPANDGVEVLSANAGDTTQTVTIIGTTNGADTVVVETVTLTGTTAVATIKTDWGVILAVKKSAATLGTVTVREASGDATITAGLTAAVLSVGVKTVAAADQLAYNRTLSALASGATTKQLGFKGTDNTNTVIYDSQALSGASAVLSNSSFRTLTEIYTGDLEATRTATVTTDGSWTLTAGSIALTGTGAAQNISLTPGAAGRVVVTVGVSQVAQQWNDGAGVSAGVWVNDTTSVQFGASSNHALDFMANAAVKGRVTTGGLFLIGTTTDSSNGIIQLAVHTTPAGGIGFGTDGSLYRVAAGILAWNTTSGNARLVLQEAGVTVLDVQAVAGNAIIAATSLTLKTNTSTTAITISSAQAVTLAGTLTKPGGATLIITNTALNNGSGASTGTLTNAPAIGNPTKWIGIDDNGTVRYVPAW